MAFRTLTMYKVKSRIKIIFFHDETAILRPFYLEHSFFNRKTALSRKLV